jgi:hypothetical protein
MKSLQFILLSLAFSTIGFAITTHLDAGACAQVCKIVDGTRNESDPPEPPRFECDDFRPDGCLDLGEGAWLYVDQTDTDPDEVCDDSTGSYKTHSCDICNYGCDSAGGDPSYRHGTGFDMCDEGATIALGTCVNGGSP